MYHEDHFVPVYFFGHWLIYDETKDEYIEPVGYCRKETLKEQENYFIDILSVHRPQCVWDVRYHKNIRDYLDNYRKEQGIMYYKATIDDNEGSKVYYDSDISSLKKKVYEEISKTRNHFFSVVYEDIDGYFDHEDVYVDKDGNIAEC